MRKTFIQILLLCLMLPALVACSKNNSQQPTGRSVSITVTKTIPADAPNDMTYAWREGDALSVVYNNGNEIVNERFVLTSGAGQMQATFTCTDSHFAEQKKTDVNIIYPYAEDNFWGDHRGLDMRLQVGTPPQSVADWDVMSAELKSVSVETLPQNIELQKRVVIIHLPKGLKLVPDAPKGGAILCISLADDDNHNIGSVLQYNPDGLKVSKRNGFTLNGLTWENGILKDDAYGVFYKDPTWGTTNGILVVTVGYVDYTNYKFYLPPMDFQSGGIYTLTQEAIDGTSSEKQPAWQATY